MNEILNEDAHSHNSSIIDIDVDIEEQKSDSSEGNTPGASRIRANEVEIAIDEPTIPFPYRIAFSRNQESDEDFFPGRNESDFFDHDIDALYLSLYRALCAGVQNKRSLDERKNASEAKPSWDRAVGADISSIEASPLYRLGGGRCEYFLTLNVFVFLAAEDLAQLSQTSRFFAAICSSSQLWHTAYVRDFAADNVLRDESASGFPTQTVRPFNREKYLERLKGHQRHMVRMKEENRQLGRQVRLLENTDLIEQVLDFIQVRTLVPVCMLSIFLSVVLFCQWNDGLPIPLWSCGIPIAFSIFYMMLALYLIFKVHDRQYTSQHILRGFWTNLTGPLVRFYQEAMNESSRLFYLVQFVLAMLVVQVGLVVIKLTSEVPHSFKDELSWGIVFIPVWILFFAFIISPCSRFKVNITTFIFVFFSFWVPLFILFACLTQKLDNEHNMRMALIMIPFYFLEGIVLLASVGFLISGIINYRRGFLERLDEYYAIFLISWITLCPLIIFQALLATRDDNQIANRRSSPSATEIATPLLIMLGWITLAVTFACLAFKTKYEKARASRLQRSAGLRVIYEV